MKQKKPEAKRFRPYVSAKLNQFTLASLALNLARCSGEHFFAASAENWRISFTPLFNFRQNASPPGCLVRFSSAMSRSQRSASMVPTTMSAKLLFDFMTHLLQLHGLLLDWPLLLLPIYTFHNQAVPLGIETFY